MPKPIETYSDPRCCTCKPPPENPRGWDEVDGVKLPPITWAERYNDLMNAAADAINARIAGPDIGEPDYRHDMAVRVLKSGRAE